MHSPDWIRPSGILTAPCSWRLLSAEQGEVMSDPEGALRCGRASFPGSMVSTIGWLSALCWAAVQGVLEFLLAVLGQGGLQHGAAVLAHRLDGLVRGDLLHHQEQRRGARRQHAADLVLELAVDAGLGDLAHQGAQTGA